MGWFDKDHPPVKLPEYIPWEEDPVELVEEERRYREREFWRSYPDDTEYDDGEYEEHDPDL